MIRMPWRSDTRHERAFEGDLCTVFYMVQRTLPADGNAQPLRAQRPQNLKPSRRRRIPLPREHLGTANEPSHNFRFANR